MRKTPFIILWLLLFQTAAAQNVRIGTTTPLSRLHVADSSVVFTAGPTNINYDYVPVSGSGNRLLWYAPKAAFRVGGVTNNNWDDDSIGLYSIAAGFNTKAKSSYATAMGSGTQALSAWAVAIGINTIAKGQSAVALGNTTQANGYASSAFGFSSEANGYAATAMGNTSKAQSYIASAIGNFALANDSFATAVGNFVEANGYSATALGYANYANGRFAMALGNNSYAKGYGSIALGNSNTATGINASAFGENTLASGYRAMSFGHSTQANGEYATSFGHETRANGIYATAMNVFTKANGYGSTALGFGCQSNASASLAVGIFNDTLVAPQTGFNTAANNPLFTVGNGDFGFLHNAMVVLKNGNVGIGKNNPAARLHIAEGLSVSLSNSGHLMLGEAIYTNMVIDNNDIQVRNNSFADDLYLQRFGGSVYIGNSGISQNKLYVRGGSDASFAATSGYLILGETGAANIVIDNNEIIARNNGGTGELFLQAPGGNVGIGVNSTSYQLHLGANSAAKPTSSAWTVASDATLKTNIHDYTDGLSVISKIHPVWFTYTGEAGMPKETGVGVLAQELREIAPYMVSTWQYKNEAGKTTPYLGVDNGAMTYMLINAIKELHLEIELLKKQIKQ